MKRAMKKIELPRLLVVVMTTLALVLVGCDSQSAKPNQEMSPSEQCRGELTEPTCEQCCMKAGATEHDFDPVDDGDPRCTCFAPTR